MFSSNSVQKIKGYVFLVLALLAVAPLSLWAQSVSITANNGYVYNQNFNNLVKYGSAYWIDRTTLPGWSITIGDYPISAPMEASDGNATEAGIYSFGSTYGAAKAERSLGGITSALNSSSGNIPYTCAVYFKNNSGKTISHLRVSYKMEMWRRGYGSPQIVSFKYASASTVTASTPLKTVTELQTPTPDIKEVGAVNGNARVVEKSFVIQNVNVLPGHELKLQWSVPLSSGWGMSLDDVEIQTLSGKVFYNKNLSTKTIDLSKLSSWGTSRDGTGAQPANFSDANQHFYIMNYPANTVYDMRKWAVTGAGSKVVLGNNSTPITMLVGDNKSLDKGIIDVADYATLNMDAKVCPKLGDLGPLSTIIFGKNAPADIVEGAVFGTVVFNSGKKSKFNKKVKVKGKLDLKDAKLDLGDNDLELDYAASIVNGSASNYVVLNGKGRLRQGVKAGADEVVLPVGNLSYNPVKIKLAKGSQDDVFSVGIIEGVCETYTNDVPSSTTVSKANTVNKTWVVSEDVKGGSDIALTLTWNAADMLPGFNPASCHVKHYENGVWDEDISVAATVSGTTYSITRTGIASFSPFIVSSQEPSILPVELLNFAAKATENNTVKLSWATAMEKNNDYFAVERSQDGQNFNQIAQVNGQGDTNSRTDYSFTDNNPLAGTTYYRLRQVNLDATFEYLPIRSVSRKGLQNLSLSLYPNPAQGSQITLQVQGLTSSETVQLLISDVMGRSILQKSVLVGNNVVLAAGELKAGTYLVKVVGKAEAQTQKLVIR